MAQIKHANAHHLAAHKSHPGKRLGPPSIGATNDGYEVSPRLHVTDKTTSLIFFVDTDADISFLPLSRIKKAVAPTPFVLYDVRPRRTDKKFSR